MSTMIAALHDGSDGMRIASIPAPEAEAGDVIVRVRSAGICGSDLLNYGSLTEAESLPGGHEVAGEIVEIGEGVDPALKGRRVAVDTIGHGRACSVCWYCRMGQVKQCLNKAPVEGGGFAERMKRRAIGCYPLPDSLSWEEGALVEPLAVSVHAVRRGEMSSGETVAVLGAGNIGLTAVAAARAMGAGRIMVTARHEQQGDMAKRLGADDVLPSDGPDFREAVLEATDGRGADMAIETVGGDGDATLRQALGAIRMQGRAVILGGFRNPITMDWFSPMINEQAIIFSSCYGIIDGRHDFELAVDMMASGRVQLGQIVTHTFPLEEIRRGFDTAYDKSTGSIKVQVKVNGRA